jgi:hypothetical protein
MARWDGMVPQTSPGIDNDMSELNEAISFTRSLRDPALPFDVAYSLPPAQAAARASAYAEIGVTWLLVQLYPTHFGADWQGTWPLDVMRKYIETKPPQL